MGFVKHKIVITDILNLVDTGGEVTVHKAEAVHLATVLNKKEMYSNTIVLLVKKNLIVRAVLAIFAMQTIVENAQKKCKHGSKTILNCATF